MIIVGIVCFVVGVVVGSVGVLWGLSWLTDLAGR